MRSCLRPSCTPLASLPNDNQQPPATRRVTALVQVADSRSLLRFEIPNWHVLQGLPRRLGKNWWRMKMPKSVDIARLHVIGDDEEDALGRLHGAILSPLYVAPSAGGVVLWRAQRRHEGAPRGECT